MSRLLALCLATILPLAPAHAFVLDACDPWISVETITEPWEDYSRTYAEGTIRIFESFIDPNVASGAAIGILHPIPFEDGGGRRCTGIYFSEEYRFFGQGHIAEATASYDPAAGLTITVPVTIVSTPVRQSVTFTINQATGEVTLR